MAARTRRARPVAVSSARGGIERIAVLTDHVTSRDRAEQAARHNAEYAARRKIRRAMTQLRLRPGDPALRESPVVQDVLTSAVEDIALHEG